MEICRKANNDPRQEILVRFKFDGCKTKNISKSRGFWYILGQQYLFVDR